MVNLRRAILVFLAALVVTALLPFVPVQAATADVGIAGGGDQPWNTRRPADYAAMKTAGATRLRADIPWAYLQPESATQPYDWTLFDPIVKDAQDAGLMFLAILHMVPSWANRSRGVYAPPTDSKRMTAYCHDVVARYLPRGVSVYEIGNEVNLPHPGWTTTGRFYVANLLTPCSTGVRRAAAEVGRPVTILGVNMAPPECCAGASPATFLTDVYAANGAAQFDALSWHPYTTDPLTNANMNSVPDQLNSITVQRTGASRTIWATEYGAPTAGAASVSEARQAALVAESKTAWFRHPYAGPLFWYSSRDLGAANSADREDHFGLLRVDGSQKPGYVEFKRQYAGTVR